MMMTMTWQAIADTKKGHKSDITFTVEGSAGCGLVDSDTGVVVSNVAEGGAAGRAGRSATMHARRFEIFDVRLTVSRMSLMENVKLELSHNTGV